MNQNLVYIEIDKIFPHPDNPRKDLGDLTELADSIKTNGIMQNLTVVPRCEIVKVEVEKDAYYRKRKTCDSIFKDI